MLIESSAEPLESTLTQIVQSVFSTMLGFELNPDSTPWSEEGDRLTAAVYLTGSFNGAVLLECGHQQACQFAGGFLATDPPEAVDNDVKDVIGELANMVGGNLKCVLPPGIQLSVPSVVDGSQYSVRFCGTDVLQRLAFNCGEGPFWVTILAIRS